MTTFFADVPADAFPATGGTITGDTTVTGNINLSGNIGYTGYIINPIASGSTTVIPNNVPVYILAPSGTIATATLILPATPLQGQKVTVACAQGTVTTLTFQANSGQLLTSAAPTTITAGGFFTYMYVLTNSAWIRVG